MPAIFAHVKPAFSEITPVTPSISSRIGGATATSDPSVRLSCERSSGHVGRWPVPIIVPM